MYLLLDDDDNYWLYSDTQASRYSNETIAEAFHKIHTDFFIPKTTGASRVHYIVHGDKLYGYNSQSNERTQHEPSKIIAEFPNTTTYEEFIELYPELII